MNSQIEDIKSRLDIISLVQSYVPSLKPAGRNHFGLCPFHGEKSPSFSVNPELGIYKCFGCGEGGDVISFIQKIEGLDFREALQIAADKAGVELESFSSPKDQENKAYRVRAAKAHNLAAEYYHYLLTKHAGGKPGLTYAVEKRKLTLEVISQYKLGYAPQGYHNLESFLLKKGFNRQELISFGLLVEKNGRIYDKFRHRLMHPIYSVKGEVIAFSGRAISAEDKGPKYLNSPETPLYQKRRELYGLFQAKSAIRESKKVIVVEGNLDIVSSAKVGVGYIVCPLGTALTADQLKLLKRYAKEILFCFDADKAGQAALLRSLELAEEAGLTALALDLGEYKDVDELVVAEPKSWQGVVDGALPIPKYAMQVISKSYDLSKELQKSAYTRLCLEFIGGLRDKLVQEQYLSELAMQVGIRLEVLASEMAKMTVESKQAKQKLRLQVKSVNKVPAKEPVATANITVATSQDTTDDGVIPAETASKPNVNASLRTLLNYLYPFRDILAQQKQDFRGIYADKLASGEVELLDLALGFNESTAKPDGQSQTLLAEIISQGGKVDLTAAEAASALRRMLVTYVLKRLKQYLRYVRSKGDLVQLTSYTQKIRATEKLV
jgi:DNA primase